MRGEPWSDLELQELYEVVNDIDWFERVRPNLRLRTDAAIRRRMCQLREEAGIVPQQTRCRAKGHAITEREKARHASDRLLHALMEAA